MDIIINLYPEFILVPDSYLEIDCQYLTIEHLNIIGNCCFTSNGQPNNSLFIKILPEIYIYNIITWNNIINELYTQPKFIHINIYEMIPQTYDKLADICIYTNVFYIDNTHRFKLFSSPFLSSINIEERIPIKLSYNKINKFDKICICSTCILVIIIFIFAYIPIFKLI